MRAARTNQNNCFQQLYICKSQLGWLPKKKLIESISSKSNIKFGRFTHDFTCRSYYWNHHQLSFTSEKLRKSKSINCLIQLRRFPIVHSSTHTPRSSELDLHQLHRMFSIQFCIYISTILCVIDIWAIIVMLKLQQI